MQINWFDSYTFCNPAKLLVQGNAFVFIEAEWGLTFSIIILAKVL